MLRADDHSLPLSFIIYRSLFIVRMKIAVLGDIHGNFAALEAVAADVARWQPDITVVTGDIINRGPCSPACLAFVLERRERDGWRVLRGNHEDYVLDVARDPSSRPGLEGAVRENVRWTVRQLGPALWVTAEMPEVVRLEGPDGGEVRVVHASMRGNRDNILTETPDATLREQIAPAPAVFCCGHTHRPLIRSVDGTLVVNAGAVGLPFDGDVRACYARLQWGDGRWCAALQRVSYDRLRTARDYHASGFLTDSGPIAPLLYDEFCTARPRLFRFIERYREPVLAGALTVEEAVWDYLAKAT